MSNELAADRVQRIRQRLIASLQPSMLEIKDESHLHVGHAGARDGRGHFRIRIAAPALGNLPRLAQHRKIYAALGDLMDSDIHAVALEIEKHDSVA